ncbi:MAG: hypothetical protein R3A45_12785 [Bdellovibrionota bacterium]
MQHDGRKRALAYFTSSFSSYSGCRQYRENIEAACANIVGAPEIAKLRMPFNRSLFRRLSKMLELTKEIICEKIVRRSFCYSQRIAFLLR